MASFRNKSKARVLAITPGDPDGIGPEIVWKIIRSGVFKKKGISLLCVGAREPFDRLKAPVIEARGLFNGPVAVPRSKRPFVWLLRAPSVVPHDDNAKEKFLPGFQAGWSIEHGVALVQHKVASSLITGPISKERLQRGGFPYSGHTDFLAALCSVKDVTMMLANEKLRVSLVTTHVALKDVSGQLTREKIRRSALQTVEYLRSGLKIRKPKIAVLGLNPHSGEKGLFGDEEIRLIEPEVRALQKEARGQFEITGPHPADTLFAKHILAKKKDRFDAVICMYHDQGLIPVKLLDFPHTVNVTLGLPIIRTSVDHGVGFDIAGKNLADPSSMRAAIELALKLSGPL